MLKCLHLVLLFSCPLYCFIVFFITFVLMYLHFCVLLFSYSKEVEPNIVKKRKTCLFCSSCMWAGGHYSVCQAPFNLQNIVTQYWNYDFGLLAGFYNTQQLPVVSSSNKRKIKIRVTSKGKRHQCPYCEYSSIKNANVQRHVLIHTGVKPFKCAVCEQPFRRKEYLRSHLLTYHAKNNNVPRWFAK